MEMVKLVSVCWLFGGLAAASDFSIEIGSPVAATMPTNNERATKKMAGAFSVRTKNCAEPGLARFSGTAVRTNGAKREASALLFIAGTVPGSYVVASVDRMTEPWVAVITAECAGAETGALVPVNAEGMYDRASTRLLSHAPTDAEIESMVKQTKGGSR